MKRLLIATLVLSLAPIAAGASGGSSSSSSTVPAQSPEELAVEYYNQGLKLRDKAWELEEKIASSDKPEKLEARLEKTWGKAADAFRESISNNPTLHQAHSSLGYAYRKLGRYEDALGAYNRALEIAPGYVEAIEYRAEAYLGLDRLDDAKAAYMDLFKVDRDQADTLMTAMRGWIEAQQEAEDGASEATVEEFAGWVEERSEIASQTAMLTQAQHRAW